VDLFAFARGDQRAVHDQVEKYGLTERTYYISDHSRTLAGRVKHLAGLLATGGLWRRAEMWKALVKMVWRRRSLPLLSRGISLEIAAREILAGPYDIIHCQYGDLATKVISLKREGMGSGKFVTSFRGHDATQHAKLSKAYFAELFALGDLFLPVSRHLKQSIIALGCDENKVHVLHSGINCRRFEYREGRLEAGQSVRVVTVARLVEMKGVEYGIRSVTRLIKEGHEVEYTIIGDGPFAGHLGRLIERLGVSEQVRMAGWLDQSSVLRYIDRAHILLAPSLTASNGEMEGIPNIVKEAMAVGLPVVSTRHGGIPELIGHGVSGYLAKEGDVDDLVRCLKILLNNVDQWAALGKAGRAKVVSEFDADQLTDRLIELYRARNRGRSWKTAMAPLSAGQCRMSGG
jgi:colanic acid/amylovoran biosynthesis glycosyltransferase